MPNHTNRQTTADWIKSLPAPWHSRVVTSAAEQLPQEPGVLTAWVGGSLADGVGDVYSDVDLNLIVEDDTIDFWRTHWSEALQRCAGKLILANDLGGPIVGGFALTEAWEHIDFIVHTRSDFEQPASNLPIYDPDHLLVTATAPSTARSPYYPAAPVRFFLYLVGNLVVSLGRGELLVAHSGVNALRDQLIKLMLAENGVRKRDGNKRLNPYLTQQQLDRLEHLPTPPVSEQAIIEACRAITADFIARARLLAETAGDSFPEELLTATDRHLANHLDGWAPIDPGPDRTG